MATNFPDDLDEPSVPSDLMKQLNGRQMPSAYRPRGIERSETDGQMCLSTPSFGFLLALIGVLFVITTIVSLLLCLRR